MIQFSLESLCYYIIRYVIILRLLTTPVYLLLCSLYEALEGFCPSSQLLEPISL